MLLESEGKFQQNADLTHWTIIYWPLTNTGRGVTNSIAKIIQEPNFCHDSCKNIAKKITSWCYGILLQNNDTSVK
jgi:hypothetical protein